MTLSNWLSEIKSKKSPVSKFTENDWDAFNTFIIHRILSMSRQYIEFVNYAQTLNLNKKDTYIVYRDFLPKTNYFDPYVGKKEKKQNVELFNILSKYYECGLKEAKEYADLLTQDMKTTILSKYGLTVEEINKIINYETNTSIPTARTSKKCKNN